MQTLDHLFVTALFVAVYALTLYPTVPGGDSGELIAAACTQGIPHPPGYPLHTILGHLFFRFLPGTPAARVNFLSAVCSAATSGILFSTVEQLCAAMLLNHGPACTVEDAGERNGAPEGETKRRYVSPTHLHRAVASKLGAFLAAGMYGFSPLVWTYSVQAEVFALNNLFMALIAAQTCHILLNPPPETFTDKFTTKNHHKMETRALHSSYLPYYGAATIGLGLTNQHTLVLASAPLALSVLRGHGSWSLLRPGSLLTLAGCFLLALSPYLYLIVAGHLPTEGAWGNTSTLSGLWVHLTRSEYGSLKLYPGKGQQQGLQCMLVGLSLYLQSLVKQFGYHGLGAALLGTVASARADAGVRLSSTSIVAAWGLYVAAFHALANLPVEHGEHRDLFREVLARFWLLPNTLAAILLGLGGGVAAHTLMSSCAQTGGTPPSTTWGWRSGARIGASCCVVLGCVGHQAASNWRECDMSHEWGVWEAGHHALASVPFAGLMLVKGDLSTNAIRYLRLCEGARSDAVQIDLAHASYRWFGKKQGLSHASDVILPGPRLSRLLHLSDTYRLSALLETNVRDKPFMERKHGGAGGPGDGQGQGRGAGREADTEAGEAGDGWRTDVVGSRPVVLSTGLTGQYGEEQLAGVELWPSGVMQRAFARSGRGEAGGEDGRAAASEGSEGWRGGEGLRAWLRDCALRVPGTTAGRGGEGEEAWLRRWESVAEQDSAMALPAVTLKMLSVAHLLPSAQSGAAAGAWWTRVGCEVVARHAGVDARARGEGGSCGEVPSEGHERCRIGDMEGCGAALFGGAGEDLRREEWLACSAQLLLCAVRHRIGPRRVDAAAGAWKNVGVAFDQLAALYPLDETLQGSRLFALKKYAELVRCEGAREEVEEQVLKVLAAEGVSVSCIEESGACFGLVPASVLR